VRILSYMIYLILLFFFLEEGLAPRKFRNISKM